MKGFISSCKFWNRTNLKGKKRQGVSRDRRVAAWSCAVSSSVEQGDACFADSFGNQPS